MATVFKRIRKRYVLGGEWKTVADGKVKRRVLCGGRRVSKATPGAEVYEAPSREWYGRVGGRYVKLSANREVAEKLLRKKLSDLEDIKVNRFAKHEQAPLSERVAAFREYLEAQGRDARYIQETIRRLAVLTVGCTRLEHVTATKVNRCLNELARQGRGALKKKKLGAGPATRNTYLAAAKGFCQWCVDDRRLPDNPLAHLKKLNERVDVRRERRTLTVEEASRLIAAAERSTEVVRELTGQDRAMLYALAIGTGLRASEIASLTTDSLKLDEDPPIVEVEAAHSKRRRHEAQPMPIWLAEWLRQWLAARSAQATLSIKLDPELLWSAEKLWPGSWRRHAAEVLRADLAAAGIAYCDAAGRVFDFHSLRHQYISDLGAAGVHPSVMQDLARHSTPVLTKRYTHVALHDQVGAVQSLPEPRSAPELDRQRATGTDDARANIQPAGGLGSQMGTKRIVTRATNLPQSRKTGERTMSTTRGEKPLSLQELRSLHEAEGMGLEPTTPCGAPHF